ncbi:XrtA/PEP-CTERM system TPR-repeat protein PrsT [Candidatus Colwellia aromaticivorans]|uniref:XrtA/PEP-CTERM system TPR-repeat protein PrsT n=1 Tax=Candidatus Colwellia aromaticivorans TaxID=2267621 RepID=UPI000DF23756|nr:XrtA/PEP-CTERM system TPR-repeat protein PrsT [Candidatus Colwellia aromaticivorans]
MSINSKKIIVVSTIIALLNLAGCGEKSTEERIASAEKALKQNKANSAVIELKNLLRENGNNDEARFLLGKAYISLGDWISAEKELSKAYELGYELNLLIPLLSKAHYYLNNNKELALLESQSAELNEEVKITLKTLLAITYLRSGNFQEGKIYLYEVIDKGYDSEYTLLARAWRHGIEGNLQQAYEAVSAAIEKNPEFSEGLEYQGFLYFEAKDMKKAAISFEAFLRLHPQDVSINVLLAIAFANSNQYEKAEKIADSLLKINNKHPSLNQVKAQSRFAAKDYEQAKYFAEVAIRNDSNLLLAKVIAGVSAYNLKQNESAYTYLNSINNLLPLEHPVKKLVVALKFQLGYEQSLFDELSSTPLEQQSLEILSYSTQSFLNIGDLDKAGVIIAKAAKVAPENPQVLLQQGYIKQLNDDDSAEKLLLQALERDTSLDVAEILLVKKYLENKKFQKAIEIATSINESKPELSKILLAKIYQEKGELSAAQKLYESLLKTSQNKSGIYYQLGKIAEINDDTPLAINSFKKALTITPNQPIVVSSLIKYSHNEKYKKNIEQFLQKNNKKNNFDVTTTLALAAHFSLNKEFALAEQALDNGIKVADNLVKLLFMKGKVQIKQAKLDEALKTFEKIRQINPELIQVYIAKSNTYSLKKKLKLAIAELKKAIDLSIGNTALAFQLIELHLQNYDIQAAKKVLSNIPLTEQSQFGKDRFFGKIAFIEQDYHSAQIHLEKAYQQRMEENIFLELVQTLQHLNKHEQALALFSDLAQGEEAKKLPLKVLLKKAELLTKKNPEQAIEIYLYISKRTNGNVIVLNNLATLYLRTGENELAIETAKLALQKSPNMPEIQNTYGLVLLDTKQVEEALTYLEQSYLSDKNNLDYGVHYAQALYFNNQKEDSKNIVTGLKEELLSEETHSRLQALKQLLQL